MQGRTKIGDITLCHSPPTLCFLCILQSLVEADGQEIAWGPRNPLLLAATPAPLQLHHLLAAPTKV